MQTIVLAGGMRVANALCVERGVTAIVGGGGKTTLMLRLARELSDSGAKVVVTTSTHIWPPDAMRVVENPSIEDVRRALETPEPVCIGIKDEKGKLTSAHIPYEALCQIADYVLVEADGAKGRPLKANLAHEPDVPQCAALVVAVAGLDGVGGVIAETAFRSAQYAALVGKSRTDQISESDVAFVLTNGEGQYKGVPNKARFAILLNKADDAERLGAGMRIIEEMEQTKVERVVIAALTCGKEESLC